MAEALAYLAAATIGLWCISHAIATRKVVAGFEPTTADNHWLVLQEWVAEAVTMWGLAALLVMVTTIEADQQVTTAVYRVVAVILAASTGGSVGRANHRVKPTTTSSTTASATSPRGMSRSTRSSWRRSSFVRRAASATEGAACSQRREYRELGEA
jgi:hypothetical protein